MQRKLKIIALTLTGIIIVSLYGIYYWKTTYYSVPEDYPTIIGNGNSYYIDSANGYDGNSGLSPNLAWKSVSKVNSFTFSQGDQILFIRNGTWRERIIPQSGTKEGWIYYGAYGTGAKPLFIGSISLIDANKWEIIGNQTWQWIPNLNEDVGNLIFNNETQVGVKKWDLNTLQSQGDFFYNKTTQVLLMKSIENPATYYSTIECALGQHMIYNPHSTYAHIGAHDISNIIFENLAFKYGGAYAFKFQRVHHILVLNCDIAWMGGAEVDGQAQTRYGNGIEFFGLAFYCQANGNTMNQIYDSGISFQAINSPAGAIGISFTNNSLSKCGLAGYELWLRSDKGQLTDISFSNNSLINIGKGWGAEPNQRKSGAYWGFAFLLDSTFSSTQNLSITGNDVQNISNAVYAVSEDFNGFGSFSIDSNQYYGNSTALLFIEYQSSSGSVSIITQYTFQQYAEYQTNTGKDLHSNFFS